MFCTEHKGIKNARNIAGIISFPEEFFHLTRRLTLSHPVTKKIEVHMFSLTGDYEGIIEPSVCPTRLSNIMRNHLNCPNTTMKTYPYLNVSHMFGQFSQDAEILEIYEALLNIHENCSKLSGTIKEACQSYQSSPLKFSDLTLTVRQLISDCYLEEKQEGNTILSFR